MHDITGLKGNPYVPDDAAVQAEVDWRDAERIRHENIKQETSIRTLAYLYFLLALFSAFATLAFLRAAVGLIDDGAKSSVLTNVLGTLVFSAIAALSFWCGHGLRRLDARVRWPAMLLASPALLFLPIGTVVAIQTMHLLSNKQGKFILSPQYHRIIQATPYAQPISSTFRLFVIGLVVSVALIAILIWSIGG